jgi:hypothetical protein
MNLTAMRSEAISTATIAANPLEKDPVDAMTRRADREAST